MAKPSAAKRGTATERTGEALQRKRKAQPRYAKLRNGSAGTGRAMHGNGIAALSNEKETR